MDAENIYGCCDRWLNKQSPADTPFIISWEAAQLLLPILLCGLLAVCVQACSGSTPSANSAAQQRDGGDTAAARQARDDALHDRWAQRIIALIAKLQHNMVKMKP